MAGTCPECGFDTLHEQRVRHPDTGRDHGGRTTCSQCGAVVREDVDVPAPPEPR